MKGGGNKCSEDDGGFDSPNLGPVMQNYTQAFILSL